MVFPVHDKGESCIFYRHKEILIEIYFIETYPRKLFLNIRNKVPWEEHCMIMHG